GGALPNARGRPRGRERLRQRVVGTHGDDTRGVSAPPCRRLSGLLRAHAAAGTVDPARECAAPPRAVPLWQLGQLFGPRRAPISHAAAVRGPAVEAGPRRAGQLHWAAPQPGQPTRCPSATIGCPSIPHTPCLASSPLSHPT